MNTEITCALIVLAGTVASGMISWVVARSSAEKELRKMRLSWEHDSALSSDDDYSEMAAAVALCLQNKLPESFDRALSYVAALRIKETSPVSQKLDELYDTLYQISPNSGAVDSSPYSERYRPYFDRANACLSEVIKEKRKHTRAQHRSDTHTPKS